MAHNYLKGLIKINNQTIPLGIALLALLIALALAIKL